MSPKRFNRVEIARQFGLCQRRMDFVVADLVQQNCRPTLAAAQFRDKMMMALAHIRWDGTATERALGRIGHAI